MKRSPCISNFYLTLIFLIELFALPVIGMDAEGDILLKISQVEDPGNRWNAASIAMILKFHDSAITLNQVFIKSGNASVINYGGVSEWAKREHRVSMVFSENGSIQSILSSIDKKWPVMVLQQISETDTRCTLRIAAGYNQSTREILCTDPSRSEPYRISYKNFEKLWERAAISCKGWPRNPYWTARPAGYDPYDFVLAVPFEANRGNTCASSAMAMMLKYHGADVTFEDVLARAGLPPVIAYDRVNQWSTEKFKVSLVRMDSRNIDDIITCVKKGYPVMVLQQFSPTKAEGHNRVVVGYNIRRSELILNDPSELGYEYRMSFRTFEKLWDLAPAVARGWPPRPMWLMLPAGKGMPLK